jgi:predicted RNase H-like HicB family nuclease
MNLSDKKVIVVDGGGLFSPLAERLAKDFEKVGYFVEWQSSFPDGKDLVVGTGIEGVERVKYLWDVIDDYDLFVFPDVWQGDLQEYLRKQGKRVWGTGKASTLELSRWKTKELMKQAGLPSKNDRQVTGITELRAALKTAKDVFVKISQFRGLHETFHSANEADSKGVVDELEAKYGPILELIPFIIEECIPDAMEIGYDGFCIDGEFPDQSFIGIEIKDKAYFGKLINYDDLPESVRKVNEAFAPHMQGYRQFFSTEIREKDGKGYLIDLTCRQPSPAGEPEIHAMDNLAEVLWFGAEGKLVQPKYSAKFVAQVILCSDWAQNHIQMVEFPDEVRPFVKLYNHAIIEGKDYVINQPYVMKQIGSVIGLGNTPEEAVKMAKENAEKVTGFDIEREVDALDKAVKEMEDAK